LFQKTLQDHDKQELADFIEKKEKAKFDILLDYKTYFRITRNWQIAFERPFTQAVEQPAIGGLSGKIPIER